MDFTPSVPGSPGSLAPSPFWSGLWTRIFLCSSLALVLPRRKPACSRRGVPGEAGLGGQDGWGALGVKPRPSRAPFLSEMGET